MPDIVLIWAMSENRVIAREGSLPWHVSGDLKMFRRRTLGNPVIMGRRTLDSIGNRPLSGRTNIVLTRRSKLPAGVQAAADIDSAIALASQAESRTNECFVVGGGDVYAQTLAMAKRLYVTVIHGTMDGDLLFPPFDWDDWPVAFHAYHEQAEGDTHAWSEYILRPRSDAEAE